MKFDPEIHHRRSIRFKGYDYSRAGLYYITICCSDRICRFGNIEMPLVGAGLAPALESNAPALESNAPTLESNAPAPESNGVDDHNRAGVNPAPTMILNEFGKIAYDEWIELPQRFHNMELDVFQIMPNHIHAIIILNEISQSDSIVGAGLAPAQIYASAKNDDNDIIEAGVNPAPTIGMIIGAYKSLVSNACLQIFKSRNEKMGKLWQRNYYEHIIRNEISLFNITEYIINNPVNWGKDEFFGSEF
jgi:putative transposase